MSDLDKAFIELRRRIRDIPIESAIRGLVQDKFKGSRLAQSQADYTISVINIYREAIYERIDSVAEDWE